MISTYMAASCSFLSVPRWQRASSIGFHTTTRYRSLVSPFFRYSSRACSSSMNARLLTTMAFGISKVAPSFCGIASIQQVNPTQRKPSLPRPSSLFGCYTDAALILLCGLPIHIRNGPVFGPISGKVYVILCNFHICLLLYYLEFYLGGFQNIG